MSQQMGKPTSDELKKMEVRVLAQSFNCDSKSLHRLLKSFKPRILSSIFPMPKFHEVNVTNLMGRSMSIDSSFFRMKYDVPSFIIVYDVCQLSVSPKKYFSS